MKVISIVSGFVTNSSSVIHGFDATVLDDHRMKTLMDKYGVAQGFLGDCLFNRSQCGSVIVTDEQKKEATQILGEEEYGSVNVNFDDRHVYIIYGDEYDSLAREINDLMQEICAEKGLASIDCGEIH